MYGGGGGHGWDGGGEGGRLSSKVEKFRQVVVPHQDHIYTIQTNGNINSGFVRGVCVCGWIYQQKYVVSKVKQNPLY